MGIQVVTATELQHVNVEAVEPGDVYVVYRQDRRNRTLSFASARDLCVEPVHIDGFNVWGDDARLMFVVRDSVREVVGNSSWQRVHLFDGRSYSAPVQSPAGG